MKIESLNIGEIKTVSWRGKNVKTGIYKYPVTQPLMLGTEDVLNDSVVDRKYHGGIDKACYSYSANAYVYWKNLYPDTIFNYGFFGENLTINHLSESEMRIGNQYKVGEAIIEVSQPREPCFKLGIRFGSQKILKPFVNCDYPGVYFRVLKPGMVTLNDNLELLHEDTTELTVLEIYKLIYGRETSIKSFSNALTSKKLASTARKAIESKFKSII